MNTEILNNILKRYNLKEIDIDIVIQQLKNQGFTQMECTKILCTKLHFPLPEADRLIVNSKAWENKKDDVLRLRDQFLQNDEDNG